MKNVNAEWESFKIMTYHISASGDDLKADYIRVSVTFIRIRRFNIWSSSTGQDPKNFCILLLISNCCENDSSRQTNIKHLEKTILFIIRLTYNRLF